MSRCTGVLLKWPVSVYDFEILISCKLNSVNNSVPSAERLQKLGASLVSLVPAGRVRLRWISMTCPADTGSIGMLSTGADFGSFGTFTIAAVEAAGAKEESTSTTEMGN